MSSSDFDLQAFLKDNKVLILSLKEVWFKLMITGEKDFEAREPSKWIESRLIKKNESVKYDYVLFINGYGTHRPWFICKYDGYGTGYTTLHTFTNGVKLQLKPEMYILFLGEVLHKGNVDTQKKRQTFLLLF